MHNNFIEHYNYMHALPMQSLLQLHTKKTSLQPHAHVSRMICAHLLQVRRTWTKYSHNVCRDTPGITKWLPEVGWVPLAHGT